MRPSLWKTRLQNGKAQLAFVHMHQAHAEQDRILLGYQAALQEHAAALKRVADAQKSPAPCPAPVPAAAAAKVHVTEALQTDRQGV